VRGVIVRGIALACTLRRPAVPKTGLHRTAAQDPQAPAPSRVLLPRPPTTPSTSTSPAPRAWAAKQTKAPAKRAGEGAAPLPLPSLAPLLAARRRHRSAETSRPACLNQREIHFTPQAFPQLSVKACAILNTPLKDCDPKTLKLLVSAFTQHINQVMSPEAGITDPAAAFPNLWHRLNAALADTNADASLSTMPQAVPATPADATPHPPVPTPHPPALVSAFTQHINQVMSPEAAITDPAAAFPNLLHRLNAALADTNADASFVHHAAGRNSSHTRGRRAGCGGRPTASTSAGTDDRAHYSVGKRRVALFVATTGRCCDHRRRTVDHATRRCPVRTYRARKPKFVQRRPVVPTPRTIFRVPKPTPFPLLPRVCPRARCARRPAMPGTAAVQTVSCRLDRATLRNRAPKPAHVCTQ